MKVTLGLLQHACAASPAENLKKTLALAEQAAKKGAKIICTQELFRGCVARARSRGAWMHTHAAEHPVSTVLTYVDKREDGNWLCIPDGHGYPVLEESFDKAMRG